MAGTTSASMPAPAFDSSEQQASQQASQQVPQQLLHPTLVSLSEATRTSAGKIEHAVQPLNPTLVSLSEAFRTSAGKIEHAVLDQAETACQRFMDKKDDRSVLEDTPISYERCV